MPTSKHRYAHEIDPNGGSAAAILARMIPASTKVLELGTGPGTVTRMLHAKGCRVTGIELDGESIEQCRPFCDRIFQADLNSTDWFRFVAGEQFDVILGADVFEHLMAPEQLMQRLTTLLSATGLLAVSLPNASHVSVLACLLNGRFPYQTKGLLDATHLRFFGRKDIESLLYGAGFVWDRWETVEVPPAQSELKGYWDGLDEQTQHLLLSNTTDGHVYQHVVLAHASSASAQLHKLVNTVEEQRLRVQTLETENEKSAQLLRQFEEDLRVSQEQVADLRVSQEQVADLRLRNEQNEAHIAAYKHRIVALEGSTSWKITWPLRAIGKLLRSS